jgi:Flp pilus assembly protein TadG
MTGRFSLFARLRRDRRGVTIVEFAIVVPVMLMLIMGLGELTYQGYVQSVLTGAVQKAARDSGIESATMTAIDQTVENTVRAVAGKAQFVPAPTRKSYSSFSAMAPEPFTDSNGNGQYDKGECFSDVNHNGVWDTDPANSGQGGASDVTVYTVTATFPRLFPIAQWIGWGDTATIHATTILKNQPYKTQSLNTPTTICT